MPIQFLVTNENINPKETIHIASELGLNFNEIKLNIQNANQIWTFLTTQKSCDCSSVLGSGKSIEHFEPDWEKEQKKLERKKFSKNRIQTVLEQKRKEFKNKIQSEKNENKTWLDFLNSNSLKMKINEIGILYHQFSGKLQNEKVKITKETNVYLKIIDITFLKNIKEDELNWIKLWNRIFS